MKRTATIIAALMLTVVSCWAVKAQRTPVTVTQPDGTKLTVVGHGDQDLHWHTTADGVLLAQTGRAYYIAQVAADGTLQTTTLLAHEAGHRSIAEQQAADGQPRQLFYSTIGTHQQAAKSQRLAGMKKERLSTNTTYFPHSGSPRAVVILAEFQDEHFKNSYDVTREVFEQFLNADGQPRSSADTSLERCYGSVKQYFKDMSFGAYTPQFDVYGPVRLPQNMAYYGEGDDDHMDRFIPDACKAVDDLVDFSQYDANGDGMVDLVYVIFAGYGNNYTGTDVNCIWPKSGTVSGGTYDGKHVWRYGVHSELGAFPEQSATWGEKRIMGPGLFVHEFSHCMGLPDIYPTEESARGDNQAMEEWDVMDGGEYVGSSMGYYPTEYTPWEREVMGWMTCDELTAAQQVKLATVQNGGKAYKVMNDNDNTRREYFLLFNVQNEGWNAKLRGHGMLVMHLNYTSEYVGLYDHPNNVKGQPRLTLVPADGLLISSYSVRTTDTDPDPTKVSAAEYRASYGGDPFPGTGEVHFLTDTSAVKPILYVGEALNKPIYNIQEADGVITFDYLADYTAGISGIVYDPDGGRKRIYSVGGTYMGDDLNSLPKGVYIINRKKIVK